jgi:hypothetical protein
MIEYTKADVEIRNVIIIILLLIALFVGETILTASLTKTSVFYNITKSGKFTYDNKIYIVKLGKVVENEK